MKRWLMLLILLAPCTGCMMLEEMFGDDTPGYHAYQPPQPTAGSSCGTPIRNVAASQTAEPELLQVRK